jgi:hypothetical protein
MLALTLLVQISFFTESKPLVQLAIPTFIAPEAKYRIEPNMGRYAEEVQYVVFVEGGVVLFTHAGMVDSSGVGVVLKNSKNGVFNALGFRCAKRNTVEDDGPMYIPHYSTLVRRGVYDGIDAIYELSPEGEMEVSFFLQAEAKLSDIAMLFQGVEKIESKKNGELTLKTITGRVSARCPRILRFMGDRFVPLPVAMRLGNDGLVRISGRQLSLGSDD